MIKQIFTGLLLGLIITITSLKHDPYIKKVIDDGFRQAFVNALDCTIDCTVDEVSFLQPGINLVNVTVIPRNGATGWRWTARKYNMYCSWWHLITKGIVNLHVDMEDVDASSNLINGKLAIMPHLEKMAVGDPNVPMAVHYINLQKATFTVVDPNASMRYSMTWKSKTIKQKNRLESQIQILDGQVTHGLKKYLHSINGAVSCGVNEVGTPDLIVDANLCATVDHVLNQPLVCTFKTTWNYDQGTCQIIHNDQIFTLKECSFKTVNGLLHGHSLVDFEILKIGNLNQINIPVCGKGSATIDGILGQQPEVTIKIAMTDIGYDKKIYLPKALVDCSYKKECWNGSLKGQAKNNVPLAITVKADTKDIAIKGNCDGYTVDVLVRKKDQWQLQQAQVKNLEQKNIITAHSKENAVVAHADLSQLKPLIKKYTDFDLEAEGTVACRLQLDNRIVLGDIIFQKGFIRIPDTFNGITHAHINGSFDSQNKLVHINSAQIGLNEGSISCNNGALKIASDGSMESYYANLLVDHALFNVITAIDLYVSGNVMLSKKSCQAPLLSGNIILDDFQLRENPLSSAFIAKIAQVSKQSSPTDIQMNCDLSIITKKAITVTTPWLEIAARARVKVTNNFAKPHIEGSIIVDNGIMHLPYRPLMICRGMVTFNPEQIDNPFIELIAKNTIKHHDVSMQIAGPLQDLNVALISNPLLTEAQIISLLLTGSAYGSLGIIVPSLALYSIKNLLFDIEQSPIKVSGRAQEWLAPLRSVYFVPLFDDQRARGGLRGAFEIEVTDRIHALIQKNFTLTEDTRFELEYMLSDDMSIRAVRDERRDVNGQVEMRWKF
jgi:predicted phosphodiesterase